ncbi:hypothetical protein F5Y00DRAFT_270701 [Daldinia vernicosa]|uniref:uncharacterized protein n=1 Tax=Daldinia vernicosa TaxID=114800 RepID=UPI002008485A|nr:uncharacterized protein F5Y00DRAFT_270701 [Daldinia vernicosa]KAI0853562.1 hypothetical protein F5Y00DRAFT_270701 [Daldinia vernicosa]
MPSNTDRFSLDLIRCCMPCLLRPEMSRPTTPTDPTYLRNRYNAQVRENLNLDHGQRPLPLHLPATLENEQTNIPLQSTHPAPAPTQPQLPRPPLPTHARPRPGLLRQRFPTTANGEDPRASWSTSPLDAAELAQVFSTIAAALEHVPYAICGLGALADHGFAARRVARVSILCSAHAKDNVRAWLAASGYDVFADSVGVPVKGNGNRGGGAGRKVCRVRIKYLDEGFERLEKVRSRVSGAWVLGLASQLDHAAAGYVDYLRRRESRRREEGKGKEKEKEDDGSSDDNNDDGDDDDDARKEDLALETIAGDIFWMLDKAARTNHVLDPRLLSTLLGQDFWIPFTDRYVNARPEMARAGIDVAAVLATHRAEQAVKEHDDMLRSYGVDPQFELVGITEDGVVTQQPRVFEGMHTLQGNAQPTSLPEKKKKQVKFLDGLRRSSSKSNGEGSSIKESISRRIGLARRHTSKSTSGDVPEDALRPKRLSEIARSFSTSGI